MSLPTTHPVVKLVHAIIADAVRRGASDIHFEPRASDMRVRFRVDGVVFDSTTVPRHLVSGLVSRIKIMAELDIAEKRLPQDGRIGLSVEAKYVDLRVPPCRWCAASPWSCAFSTRARW